MAAESRMSSPRGPGAPNDDLLRKEAANSEPQCVRDRASARRARMMLMAASSGDCQQLRRGEILPAAPVAPASHELVIDVDDKPPAAALERGGGVTKEATGGGSALHVVAAAGAGQCRGGVKKEATGGGSALHVVAAAGAGAGRHGKPYLDSATAIYGKARHLLTSRNAKGDTPLHCAARAGNTDMVRHLISLARGGGGEDEVRALVRAQNARGETGLHEAVRFGDTKMVGALLDADWELVGVVANDGTSPMYVACSLGRRHLACELHGRGHRVSYSGPDGQNALHAAVIHKKGLAKLLLAWEKDLVNQVDINGSTPMHFAASAADPSVQFTSFVFTESNFERHFLGSNLLPQKCLTELYTWRDLPLPLLLEAEPSLAFQPDIHGSFPVHVAASADSMVSIIVLLTRYPGCAGLLDGRGRTFLHVAVEKKRFHVVQFACHCARSFRPALNVQDEDGNTALHLAVKQGDVDIFRCLIRNRHVNINLQNNQGDTPMDIALGKVCSGFYFGLTAPRRILGMLSLVNAQNANRRRDQIEVYNPRLNDKEESKKITEFAQIVGIGSVLVATATFTAAITVPGGVRSISDVLSTTTAAAGKAVAVAEAPAGTPVLAGGYAFDGFVISNTLAFICSTLATFSLVYCGVAAVDIQRRFKLVSFSLALLLCAARSFCAAFAFSLYLLLAEVEHGTAVAACVMTSLALLDGIWFLIESFHDTTVLLSRRTKTTLLKLATGFVANIIYLFWPYIVIFGYMSIDALKHLGRISSHSS